MNLPPAEVRQARRWQSPLIVTTLAGLLFATLTGSLLLFFGAGLADRNYWEFVHWMPAAIVLPVYASYQLRHYLRVRAPARPTHYRVGLHAFYLMCGASLSGLALLVPAVGYGSGYVTLDLLHIFFGYGFVLLLSAHLTLVALLTVGRLPPRWRSIGQRAVALCASLTTAASVALLAIAIAGS
ncbi:MAG: hypothetical protein R3E77_15465 [Steroidobacteraceae bacterium]